MGNDVDEIKRKGRKNKSGGYHTNQQKIEGYSIKDKFPYYLGLLFLSPVLALLSGITNFKEKSAKIILILFMGVLGYLIILNPGSDSHTLSLTFINHYSQLSFNEFITELLNIISLKGSGTIVDEPYLSVLSYIIAQFTDNPRWLFAVTGTVYGFIYIKSISLVYREIQGNWNLSIIFLFLLFIFWTALEGINAPRTYTSAWVYFCGTFLYCKTDNKKYVFLALFSPFIHIAYLAFLPPLFIYMFFKDIKRTYMIVLIISYFFSAQLAFLEPILTTTELGKTKTEQYTGERWQNRVESDNRVKSFHAEYYEKAASISIQFMLIASFFFSGYLKNKNHNRLLDGLGGISILLLISSNIFVSSIPILSGRLFVTFGLFALAYLLILYSQNFYRLKSYHWIINLCIPAIMLFIFTQSSIMGDLLDFKILFSPLFYPLLADDPVSIKAFIRQLLGI